MGKGKFDEVEVKLKFFQVMWLVFLWIKFAILFNDSMNLISQEILLIYRSLPNCFIQKTNHLLDVSGQTHDVD